VPQPFFDYIVSHSRFIFEHLKQQEVRETARINDFLIYDNEQCNFIAA